MLLVKCVVVQLPIVFQLSWHCCNGLSPFDVLDLKQTCGCGCYIIPHVQTDVFRFLQQY